ncbi:uncharacterized protein A4U43_C07F21890 [Asparagus officinalis]|uniref:[Histone H3]-trimethyl-L-lysine(4) demethylase n=1 Tax=Asparagus officinalis TaxID=4686 RepID=A0A5P1EHA0_ASPOF|nr:uncharacterized protein A4U43_C07F21890 [Asparagus officinalis]
MGKGRPRAIEKSIRNPSFSPPPIPQAPVFYPTEEEFKDPLDFIFKIRPQAEPFGICRIVPPKSWSPPFALDAQSFTFPTKSQAIHRLQARPPSYDSETFELEYSRFLENQLGKKLKKKAVFEGKDLDLCRAFNAVKRYGGYDKVCEGKKWGEVARLVRPNGKISECAKHVLCQLYREHLYEYEEYQSKKCKREREQSGYNEKKGSKKRKKSDLGVVERVKEEVKEEFDQICEQCKSGLHGEVMLLCDRCDKGWHLHCLTPPLKSVPPGNWYCLECVNSDKDSFGFVPGKDCSLEIFRRKNDRVKRKWLGQTCTTRAQIEKRFWEIVEGKGGEVEVMYGSDLDTSVYGSGFPRVDDPVPASVDSDVWREYCSSPWNLNNLPKLSGSMLRAVHDNIAGVMVPWLYIGMLFSSFCWHVEDHFFYSINYMHWGEPKCWYGVPGAEASAFEQVMRNTLPDLFDAQPDLLFQLVTMLNPSVLQENGVPVYNVLQEPGNFVVTFPKSFHGGFNFGLNCAEAVNFAPADWLPHGGRGAEWYRLYHKAAVLSHEELLCVVSKNGCDNKALPYLEEEMHRIFAREKKCREELWKNGIVRSSRMLSRKQPMYVGTEEDPTCIICQQYLYLSAISCKCRPSAFVCLEHWKHLCECKPSEHRLLYRQTLAELRDLVCIASPVSGSACEENHCSSSKHGFLREPCVMIKKVKTGQISYVQLAEQWLSNSCHLLELPFSNFTYKKALKEAEQFLWADHELDPVRDMASRLMEARKWALNIRNILSRVEDCLQDRDNQIQKVPLREIEELLMVNPLPCSDPGHVKLKTYSEDARALICEIESAFLSCLEIGKLEILYSRATKFPIMIEGTAKLENEISSAKVWISDAAKCLSGGKVAAVGIDFLNKVKSEMAELRVRLPDMDSILKLCREVNSWQTRCSEFLKGSAKLKDLQDFLQDTDDVRVTIPELELLRQYHADACTWICHLNDVLSNLNEREDHDNVVRELSCILEAGKSLRVQVDELPVVEAELNKFSCRLKASKAVSTQMPLDFLQQLLSEASLFEIKNEKRFLEISRVIAAAVSWEERAKFVLECRSSMSEFEEVSRSSENIFVILPSLPNIKDAISIGQSWISRSQPYLTAVGDSSVSALTIDALKELITESKHMKVAVDGLEKLQSILDDVNKWENVAHSLLEDSKALIYSYNSDISIDSLFSVKVEELLTKIDSAIETGRLLGLELSGLPNLRRASLILHWSLKALSFCSRIPSYEEVDSLLDDSYHLPTTFLDSNFAEVLNRGSSWLRKATLMSPGPRRSKRCKLKDVEEILEEHKKIGVRYPLMVAYLQDAIGKHELVIFLLFDSNEVEN